MIIRAILVVLDQFVGTSLSLFGRQLNELVVDRVFVKNEILLLSIGYVNMILLGTIHDNDHINLIILKKMPNWHLF